MKKGSSSSGSSSQLTFWLIREARSQAWLCIGFASSPELSCALETKVLITFLLFYSCKNFRIKNWSSCPLLLIPHRHSYILTNLGCGLCTLEVVRRSINLHFLRQEHRLGRRKDKSLSNIFSSKLETGDVRATSSNHSITFYESFSLIFHFLGMIKIFFKILFPGFIL